MTQPVSVDPPAAEQATESASTHTASGSAHAEASPTSQPAPDDDHRRGSTGNGHAPRPDEPDAATDSLHPPHNPPAAAASDTPESPEDAAEGTLTHLKVQQIRPNPHQPREAFDPAALQRLADSIRREGMMQPIVVRPLPVEQRPGSDEADQAGEPVAYELVAGERRWRAARLAKLPHVPAIIRDLDERQIAEWALIENLQREDLNPMERATAFQRLVDAFGLAHDEVATRVGVDRSTVANAVRLLKLSEPVRDMVRQGRLSGGQARALVSVSDEQQQLRLAQTAANKEWSVRRVETAVRELAQDQTEPRSDATPRSRSPHITELEQQIRERLSTQVKINPGRKKGSGTLSITYHSIDEFERILTKMGLRQGGSNGQG